MQGNVLEWCQDRGLLFHTDLAGVGDKEQTGELSNSGLCVLRGGSFLNNTSVAASANRNSSQPESRNNYVGFRVGRTLNPVPFTALRPAEGRAGN